MNEAEDIFPCHWCNGGQHDLSHEIQVIRNEQRCSVSLLQRRFRYGYAHALEACRQLEARDWLRLTENGGCELSGKILLSEKDGGSDATGVSFSNPPAPPAEPDLGIQEQSDSDASGVAMQTFLQSLSDDDRVPMAIRADIDQFLFELHLTLAPSPPSSTEQKGT